MDMLSSGCDHISVFFSGYIFQTEAGGPLIYDPLCSIFPDYDRQYREAKKLEEAIQNLESKK